MVCLYYVHSIPLMPRISCALQGIRNNSWGAQWNGTLGRVALKPQYQHLQSMQSIEKIFFAQKRSSWQNWTTQLQCKGEMACEDSHQHEQTIDTWNCCIWWYHPLKKCGGDLTFVDGRFSLCTVSFWMKRVWPSEEIYRIYPIRNGVDTLVSRFARRFPKFLVPRPCHLVESFHLIYLMRFWLLTESLDTCQVACWSMVLGTAISLPDRLKVAMMSLLAIGDDRYCWKNHLPWVNLPWNPWQVFNANIWDRCGVSSNLIPGFASLQRAA